jgi:cytochrome c
VRTLRKPLASAKAIVANKCSSCHAVGRFGESRNAKAPAFRTLHERYPIESLAEALAEGTISAASDEPEFNFSGREVGAIISYISMIQEPGSGIDGASVCQLVSSQTA